MNIEKEKILKIQNPFLQKTCTVFVYYLVMSSIVPQMRIMPGYTLLMFFAMFMWIALAALAHPKFFTQLSVHKFFIYIFILYTFITPYLFSNGVIGNRYLQQNIVLIFYFIYQYNKTFEYVNSSRLVLKYSFPFIIFTVIVTLNKVIDNPYMARSIKSGGEYSLILRAQGVGGYELIYFLVFVSIILFYIILNINKFKIRSILKLFIIVLFILSCCTVLFSNYFTALFMMCLSFSIIIVTKNRNIFLKILFFMIGSVVLFFHKYIFINLINILINILRTGKNVDRLLNLRLIIDGYGSLDTLFQERLSTLQMDLQALKENPITGIIIKPIGFDNSFLTGFGQHSYFLDTFALFGLIIGTINVFIHVYPFIKLTMKKFKLTELNLAVMISYIILLTNNNITTSIGLVVFFIYPTIYDVLEGKISI